MSDQTTDQQPIECEHGSEARYAFVVDLTLRNDLDPYGDVEGPMRVAYLDVMQILLDHHTADCDDEGRFVMGFLHADLCRTER